MCYGIWKLSGAKDVSFRDNSKTNVTKQHNNVDDFLFQLKDFRMKMGNLLPVLPKNNPPQSRTEFNGMNDLLTYIAEEYGKK